MRDKGTGAYREGVHAWWEWAEQNKCKPPEPACPYQDGTRMADDWRRGYNDAKGDWEAQQEGVHLG